MNRKHYIFALLILLAIIPAGIVWTYWQDALQYENSPHISTFWDKNEPVPYLDDKSSVRQSFVPVRTGLSKITLQVASGKGEYQWSIKKSLTDEALYSNSFKGNIVQNYAYVDLQIPGEIAARLIPGNEYWLELKRVDQSPSGSSQGIGLFQTQNNYEGGTLFVADKPLNNDLVFQLYYSATR